MSSVLTMSLSVSATESVDAEDGADENKGDDNS